MQFSIRTILGLSLLVVQCQGIGQEEAWLTQTDGRDPSETQHYNMRYSMQAPTTSTPSPGTATITPTITPVPGLGLGGLVSGVTATTTPKGEWPMGKKVAVGVISGVGGAAAIALTGVAIHASVENDKYSTVPPPTPLFNASGTTSFAPFLQAKEAGVTEAPAEDKSSGVSSGSSITSSGGSSGSWIFWLIFILLWCCCACIGGGIYFFYKKPKKSRKVKKADQVAPAVGPAQVTDTQPLMSPVEAAGPLMDSRVKYNPTFEPPATYTYTTPSPAVYTTAAPTVYTTPAATTTTYLPMAAPVTTALPSIMEAAPVATIAAPMVGGYTTVEAAPVVAAPMVGGYTTSYPAGGYTTSYPAGAATYLPTYTGPQ